VNTELTLESTTYLRPKKILRQDGVMTLRTRLVLWKILCPASQSGETLDYQVSEEEVTIFRTSAKTKCLQGPVECFFDRTIDHSVVRNFDPVEIGDAPPWRLVPSLQITPPPAPAAEEGSLCSQCWVAIPASGGCVFVTLGRHYSRAFDDPVLRILVFRGLAWSVNEPVGPFNKLVRAGIE